MFLGISENYATQVKNLNPTSSFVFLCPCCQTHDFRDCPVQGAARTSLVLAGHFFIVFNPVKGDMYKDLDVCDEVRLSSLKLRQCLKRIKSLGYPGHLDLAYLTSLPPNDDH